jgi:hypothetical protein
MTLLRKRRYVLNMLLSFYMRSAGRSGIVQCIRVDGRERGQKELILRSCNRENCSGKRPVRYDDDLGCEFVVSKTEEGEEVRECVTRQPSDLIPHLPRDNVFLVLDVKDDMPHSDLFSCHKTAPKGPGSEEERARVLDAWRALRPEETKFFLEHCERHAGDLAEVFESLRDHAALSPFLSEATESASRSIFLIFRDEFAGKKVDDLDGEDQRELLADGLLGLEAAMLGDEDSNRGVNRTMLPIFQTYFECGSSQLGGHVTRPVLRKSVQRAVDSSSVSSGAKEEDDVAPGRIVALTRSLKLECVENLLPERFLRGGETVVTFEGDWATAAREWTRNEGRPLESKIREEANDLVELVLKKNNLRNYEDDDKNALCAHVAGYVKLTKGKTDTPLEQSLDDLTGKMEDLEFAAERWRKLFGKSVHKRYTQRRRSAYLLLSVAEEILRQKTSYAIAENMSDVQVSALLSHAARLVRLRPGTGSNRELLVSFVAEIDAALSLVGGPKFLPGAVIVAAELSKQRLQGVTVCLWLRAARADDAGSKTLSSAKVKAALLAADHVCAPVREDQIDARRVGERKCEVQSRRDLEERMSVNDSEMEGCRWKITTSTPPLQCVEAARKSDTKEFQKALTELYKEIEEALDRHLEPFTQASDADADLLTRLETVLVPVKELRADGAPKVLERLLSIADRKVKRGASMSASEIVASFRKVSRGQQGTGAKQLSPWTAEDARVFFELLDLGMLSHELLLLDDVVAENASIVTLRDDDFWTFYVRMSTFLCWHRCRSMLRLSASLLQRPRKLLCNRISLPLLTAVLYRYCHENVGDHGSEGNGVVSGDGQVSLPRAPTWDAAAFSAMRECAEAIQSCVLTDRKVDEIPDLEVEETAHSSTSVTSVTAAVRRARELVRRALQLFESLYDRQRAAVDEYVGKNFDIDSEGGGFVFRRAADRASPHVASTVRVRVTKPFMTSSPARTSMKHALDTDDVEELLTRPLSKRSLRELSQSVICARVDGRCQISKTPPHSTDCVSEIFGVRCWEDVLLLPPLRAIVGKIARCRPRESTDGDLPHMRVDRALEDLVRQALVRFGAEVTRSTRQRYPEFGEVVKITADLVVRTVELLRDTDPKLCKSDSSSYNNVWDEAEGNYVSHRLCTLFRSVCVTLALSTLLRPRVVACPQRFCFELPSKIFAVSLEGLGDSSPWQSRESVVMTLNAELDRADLEMSEGESAWTTRSFGGRIWLRNLVDLGLHNDGEKWNLRVINLSSDASVKKRSLDSPLRGSASERVLQLTLRFLSLLLHPVNSPGLCEQLLHIALNT